MLKTLALFTALVLATVATADPENGSGPEDAVIIKQTITEVLSAAQAGGPVDRLQLAIQPLLFLLARRHDAATDQVLLDLSTYRLGEANSEVYHCILTRRGEGFAKGLRSGKLKNDCRRELGANSRLCLSDAERLVVAAEVMRRIQKKVSCNLEY
jgi:hypothetical protein